MKKASQSAETGARLKNQDIKSVLAMRRVVTKLFGEHSAALDALLGLTSDEVNHLRFLLLRCVKSYHSKHPSDFSLRLLLLSEEKRVNSFDT